MINRNSQKEIEDNQQYVLFVIVFQVKNSSLKLQWSKSVIREWERVRTLRWPRLALRFDYFEIFSNRNAEREPSS